MKEIASKMIVYNIHKSLLWFFIEVFYGAVFLVNDRILWCIIAINPKKSHWPG
jgi:hypothetical protein